MRMRLLGMGTRQTEVGMDGDEMDENRGGMMRRRGVCVCVCVVRAGPQSYDIHIHIPSR